ncbi:MULTISPECIES: TetR/AcrR family transcriptional regulator [Cobetia]|uniref:TetR/AcrR family transcriptional regulator n=1 Tax=Cobetia TaxID=204286 RepID=UPI001582DD36|nr:MULTISPECIES: TetR/AcrR family transcriptional regulator [Cobetia]MDI4661247.1 TetR/AcrR family transcriptional regulator [Cobetia sp. BMC6]NUJ55433.1 TetR/AcrR family transcriptional regulator [Cobetia marina]
MTESTATRPESASARPEGRGKAEDWLEAAYQQLLLGGVDSVRVLTLAKTLGLSRTSFYWSFKDRDALLAALLARWDAHNTASLIGRCEQYAATVVEAMLNVFDCWLDESLFDSRFELAIRNWGLKNDEVAAVVDRADQARLQALTAMLMRHGQPGPQADVRARTIYLTQIGYLSMRTQESVSERISRVAEYVEVFVGERCAPQEVARFAARHPA